MCSSERLADVILTPFPLRKDLAQTAAAVGRRVTEKARAWLSAFPLNPFANRVHSATARHHQIRALDVRG